MSILDDTALFVAIIQQGGFSHAARFLGLSNGLISRRINNLEKKLGVTLLKRTTRQIQLTPEGQVFWQHAKRIQQEIDAAVCLIQASTQKPTGTIRVSAPIFFGRNFLNLIFIKFMQNFADIKIDLVLNDRKVDPIKENFDLVFRGCGYLESSKLQDSSLKMKWLLKKSIGLYATSLYLNEEGEPKNPQELMQHNIVGYSSKINSKNEETWEYADKANTQHKIILKPFYKSNDIDCRVQICLQGLGIGKFTEYNVQPQIESQQLKPILTQYNWGEYNLYAIYPNQAALPARTRLLLDFVAAHTKV